MKISTHIGPAANIIGEEKAIEYVAKAGFDAWDFSMFKMCKYDRVNKCVLDNDHPLAGADYLKFARRLKQIGLDNGIVCNQAHAPFPSFVPQIRETYLKRAIECTAEAGGEICIIHPDNHSSAEENAEFYRELLPFAKEHGVKIATENMWNWEKDAPTACAAACSHHDDFCKHIDIVNDPYLVACLDIGHAEMAGLDTNAVQMLETLGSHVQALHIHDNDCLHDSHALPYTMKIHFEPILETLKKIGYQGDITMEASYARKFPVELYPQAAKLMAEIGKYMRDKLLEK
jgi:sugar phosphate isomerase/epimerase